jgi:predicted RNase H-like HicB family nuclease
MAIGSTNLLDDLMKVVREQIRRVREMVAPEERSVRLRVEIREDEIDGGFVATCIDLPGCGSQGDTVDEAVENIIEAISGVLETQMHREVRAELPHATPRPGHPQRLAFKIPA